MLLVYFIAGHIRRQQVGGELDAAEARRQGAGEGLDGACLGGAGHILDEKVALAQQGHKG